MKSIGKTAMALAMLLAAFASTSAQTIIKGHIKDSDGEPVAGAMVRAYDGSKIKAFASSRSEGDYQLKIPASVKSDSVKITVQSMGHASFEKKISLKSQTLDFALTPTSTTLREVSVSAPYIYEQGDTLTYNLAKFLGKGDITLEDGLKKLPGVDVSESGKISYQGKGIKKFYIEGLDLLGGKYSLATKNLPATHVTGVEIISNHNDAKIDKDKQSDDVALNVRLDKRAKFKPVGTSEATLAYSDKFRYYLGLTGMIFTPDFQSIVTLKSGNAGQFASSEMADHIVVYGANSSGSKASEVLGRLSGSTPPMKSSRYISPLDHNISANALKKTSENATLKAEASYTYTRKDYSYEEQSDYYAGDDILHLTESNTPESNEQTGRLKVNYTLNSDEKYFQNDFDAQIKFMRDRLATISNGTPLSQRKKTDSGFLSDNISWRVKRGNMIWNLSGALSYSATPTGQLKVESKDSRYDNIIQNVDSHTFRASMNAGSTYSWRNSRLYFSIGGRFIHDRVNTELIGTDDINRLRANTGTVLASAFYTYTAPNRRYEYNAGMEGIITLMNSDNRATGDKVSVARFDPSPNIRFKYNLNRSSSVILMSSFKSTAGDILEALTAPVATSYLMRRTRSGISAKSSTFNAGLRYEFKKPMEFWFANAGINFTSTKTNTLASQNVSDTIMDFGYYAADNSLKTLTAYGSVTKQIPSIKGKFTLGINYNHSGSSVVQQERKVNYTGNIYSLTPSFNISPVGFMEIRYNSTLSLTDSRYLGQRESYRSWDNDCRLMFFPKDGITLFAEGQFLMKEIPGAGRKKISLFDAGVRYRHKAVSVTFRVDNILDTRRYYYTSYSGLDTHSYSYTLMPRMFSISIMLTR